MRYVKKIGNELYFYDTKFDSFERIYLDREYNTVELIEWEWPEWAKKDGHRAVIRKGDSACMGNCHRKAAIKKLVDQYDEIMELIRDPDEVPDDEIPRIYKRCARCYAWKPMDRGHFNLDIRKVTRFMERCRKCDAEIAYKNWRKNYKGKEKG